MQRKNLSLFQSHSNLHLLTLFHSERSQLPANFSKKGNKKQSSSKDHHPSKISLSELKPIQKTTVNTVFSSRLFEKAHRLGSHNQETYLPLDYKAKPTNQSKIKDVYQLYLQRACGLRRTVTLQQTKRRHLSISQRHQKAAETPTAEGYRKLPLISSLTKIIMNQCEIPPEGCSELNDSQWIQILCELGQQESGRKKPEKCKVVQSGENPYELLPLRKKRGHHSSRRLQRQKIQKKRI